ncbi:hypothetical protein F4805DRAFT_431855 [Annulohypoxylon moriforme]|nr:hypothetical protein F4805DRAFT_431855 [Annulohypoxylon moriforme]
MMFCPAQICCFCTPRIKILGCVYYYLVLSKVPRGQGTSSTRLYRSVTKQLEELQEMGDECDPGCLEALRVLGDATHGIGTMPKTVEKLLCQTGLVWLLQPDSSKRVRSQALGLDRSQGSGFGPRGSRWSP